MASAQVRKEIERRLEAIGDPENGLVEIGDAAGLVERAVDAVAQQLSEENQSLKQGLERVLAHIRAFRDSLVGDQSAHGHLMHFDGATDELDAIVTATESASNEIMDAAEQIEEMVSAATGESAAVMRQHVTRIFEACAFQDLTGQRVTKVITTLKAVEQQASALVGNTEQTADGPVDPTDESRLLNGPALPGEAKNQADIDALFASLD